MLSQDGTGATTKKGNVVVLLVWQHAPQMAQTH